MLDKILQSSISLLSVADYFEHKMMDSDNKIVKPVDTVSIIIPSFNEEPFIKQCLQSLRNQSIVKQYPEYFEYILIDNNSTDNTVKLATPYIDKIIINEKSGKLISRNLATLYSKGNIVVAVDADIVFPYHWLNTLIKPFNNPTTVGVTGSIIDNGIKYVIKPIHILASTINRNLIHPTQMIGGNCAYWKHLFYMINGFNTYIDQRNVKTMVQEEEIGFGYKLAKFGKVIYKSNAVGFHLGGERVACRYGLESEQVCAKYGIGIKRFG